MKGVYMNSNLSTEMDKARKKAIANWKENNPLFGHVKAAASMRDDLIGKTNGTVPFVDDENILKEWGVYNWFRKDSSNSKDAKNNGDIKEVKDNKSRKCTPTAYAVLRGHDTIPCMKQKVIYMKNIGIRETYDITVENTHNFIANGIVVHNCMFACEIYKLLHNKVSTAEVNAMVVEAVNISKNFMTDALPVRLIGMNSDMMCDYIEYVGDRLLSMLGYKKIFNKKNPFGFMETIGLNDKSNLHEVRPTEYQDATTMNKNKGAKKVVIEDDF